MFSKEIERWLSQQQLPLRSEKAAFCIPFWVLLLAALGVILVAVARSVF